VVDASAHLIFGEFSGEAEVGEDFIELFGLFDDIGASREYSNKVVDIVREYPVEGMLESPVDCLCKHVVDPRGCA